MEHEGSATQEKIVIVAVSPKCPHLGTFGQNIVVEQASQISRNKFYTKFVCKSKEFILYSFIVELVL